MIILWTVSTFGFILIQILTFTSGQSTTASYLQNQPYLNNMDYPRSKSKYYYFFTPRSQMGELMQPSETETMVEDRGYDMQYEGMQAHWPQPTKHIIHQQPIHVHHSTPMQMHKEKSENNYLLPLILLALLPLLLGALVLLPLLFSFLTNVLQILALIQQNLQNNNNNGNNGGRRKRSDHNLNPIILTTLSSIFDKFISSQQKYANNH